MKKICCIALAVLFLALGIIGTVCDYQKTSQQTNKIKSYPVIKASELSEYKAKKKQKVVVTDISISGSRVCDPKELLPGKYYYIGASAEKFARGEDEDKTAQWYDEHEADYEVQKDDLRTSVAPDQVFKGEQVYYPPVLDIIYDHGVNNIDPNKGDLRYIYRGITEEDTMTAVMSVGDGEAVLEPLSESDTTNYIVGDEETYYKLIKSFVWDSFIFLIFGLVLAGILGFLAYRCD